MIKLFQNYPLSTIAVCLITFINAFTICILLKVYSFDTIWSVLLFIASIAITAFAAAVKYIKLKNDFSPAVFFQIRGYAVSSALQTVIYTIGFVIVFCNLPETTSSFSKLFLLLVLITLKTAIDYALAFILTLKENGDWTTK